MSLVFKCDRCGKSFDPPERKSMEQWMGIHRDHNMFGKIYLDLCPCCEKNLMEWFDKGVMQNETS